ncbi:GmrSD restriction endonuclease domain-containing protein [Pseudonocardia spinosispora]|uniref:restriction system modified-DNA reader domain-containing protein n=1 Tax=Pseudonocardia spinosispora TaxID=103441 RepID=UPI00048BF20A|nr:DUF1524 domain-containing protein [Pseudonocardia spinosispora]
MHDEPTRPEDLTERIFQLIPLIRGCRTSSELAARLGRETPTTDFDVVHTFRLRGDNRAQVHYILARLTTYVEDKMSKPADVHACMPAQRLWQIEHLYANHAERHPDLTPLQFRLLRDRFGALGLLPSSDNASIRDLTFDPKARWYIRRNTLLAVLSDGYARNNPALRKLRDSHRLDGTLRSFGTATPMRKVIDVRGELYRKLLLRIWDPAVLGLIVPEAETTEPTPSGLLPSDSTVPDRTGTGRRLPRTPLGTLVANGRIAPGTRVFAQHQAARQEATVDAQGLLWLSDVDSFGSPDEAGMMVTGRKSCTDWTFWHISLSDGSSTTLREFRADPSLVAQPPPRG